MYEFTTGRSRDCSGVSRRDFVRVGGLALGGLTLADALAAAAAPGRKDVSCIFLWLVGGPPQHETFDPKPEAPAEVRGEFGAIKAANGALFCDQIPLLAKCADQYSVIRSVTHADTVHETAQCYLQSGYKFSVTMNYPSFGSVVAREQGSRGGLPPYMLVGGKGSVAEGAGYFGAVHNPFKVTGDPSKPGFGVRDVSLGAGVDLGRIDRRQKMIAALDRYQRHAENAAPAAAAMDRFTQRAFELITSPVTKKAFALEEEPQALRDKYGINAMGQGCLLARRLVESGVRFVTVANGGWDTHQNHFYQSKAKLLPPVDRGMSALLQDLSDRGMLDNTLVICMGEFGRTPTVNSQAGRDHWSSTFSVALAGAGIKKGYVHGESDDQGAVPADKPVTVENLAATIYKAVGVDYHKRYDTPLGTPTPIVNGGEAVDELFG